MGVGDNFVWEKLITATKNLNLNFGANPNDPDFSVGASGSGMINATLAAYKVFL